MCIKASVGKECTNNKTDVKTVQILINLNHHRLDNFITISEDGTIGPATINAIAKFQTEIVKVDTPDGIVTPNSLTLTNLRSGIQSGFSKEVLKGIMLNVKQSIIDVYFDPLVQKMQEYEINTNLRICHFLAQIGHESGEFKYTEELANGSAYENRKDLGNVHAGDGVRFKGRGLIQLTGRANYQKYSDAKGVDYIKHPELLATDPMVAVDVACWFWTTHKLNEWADQDNVNKVTKIINGGYNGFDNRKELLERSKFFIV